MRARVRKRGLDWHMVCEEHHVSVWTIDWRDAMEMAWGHVAMWPGHPRNLDTRQSKEDAS
jgi:hypothetical protein